MDHSPTHFFYLFLVGIFSAIFLIAVSQRITDPKQIRRRYFLLIELFYGTLMILMGMLAFAGIIVMNTQTDAGPAIVLIGLLEILIGVFLGWFFYEKMNSTISGRDSDVKEIIEMLPGPSETGNCPVCMEALKTTTHGPYCVHCGRYCYTPVSRPMGYHYGYSGYGHGHAHHGHSYSGHGGDRHTAASKVPDTPPPVDPIKKHHHHKKVEKHVHTEERTEHIHTESAPKRTHGHSDPGQPVWRMPDDEPGESETDESKGDEPDDDQKRFKWEPRFSDNDDPYL